MSTPPNTPDQIDAARHLIAYTRTVAWDRHGADTPYGTFLSQITGQLDAPPTPEDPDVQALVQSGIGIVKLAQLREAYHRTLCARPARARGALGSFVSVAVRCAGRPLTEVVDAAGALRLEEG